MQVYYFGCGNLDKGHHWRDDYGSLLGRDARMSIPFHAKVDGVFAPKPERVDKVHRVVVREHGAADDAWTVLAWWDRTVDTRPGSNAVVAAPGVWAASDLWGSFKLQFPKTSARFNVTLPSDDPYENRRRSCPCGWSGLDHEILPAADGVYTCPACEAAVEGPCTRRT